MVHVASDFGAPLLSIAARMDRITYSAHTPTGRPVLGAFTTSPEEYDTYERGSLQLLSVLILRCPFYSLN